MHVLVTDSRRGMLLLEPVSGGIVPLECGFPFPCCPCASHELLFCGCAMQRDVACYTRRTLLPIGRMPAPPGLCAMCVSPCGRFLYQLGGETDSVHTRLVATGELLFASRQGVFPRSLRLHPSGRALLVAGGASGEGTLLGAPGLESIGRIVVEGSVCAADFWRGGLALLCAIEDGDIRTALYVAGSIDEPPREIFRAVGQPGGLCVCMDGVTALIGTLDGVLAISLASGKPVAPPIACPLCARIECQGRFTLLSDALDGRVWLRDASGSARCLLAASDAQAAFA